VASKAAPAVITPALRTAANLVTGSDEQTDQFLASKPWETWIFSVEDSDEKQQRPSYC